MKINIHPLEKSDLKPLISNPKELGFCRHFSDRMLVMNYVDQEGWKTPEIKKFGQLPLYPSTMALHYSQEIFEGLKAFSAKDGSINFFRPEMNARRFNRSATRLCMPTIPEADFIEGIETLVKLDSRWIPQCRDAAALYIRPFMFGSDSILGVRASSNYIYCVILSPVGPYYHEGFAPIGLYVSSEFSRAVKGGVGEVKTGGNYAASLFAGKIAKEKGCAQVLWLDGSQKKYVEEVGAMNIFFVYGQTLVTPRLNGSILPGVTRDSVLILGKDLGFKVEERELLLEEVLEGISNGQITEVFGSGTAASISPVGYLKYQEKDYLIGDQKVGPISKKLYEQLLGMQYGDLPDRFNWIRKAQPAEKTMVAV